jgi:hypothetical protein
VIIILAFIASDLTRLARARAVDTVLQVVVLKGRQYFKPIESYKSPKVLLVCTILQMVNTTTDHSLEVGAIMQ